MDLETPFLVLSVFMGLEDSKSFIFGARTEQALKETDVEL